jgi:hypothetical protein
LRYNKKNRSVPRKEGSAAELLFLFALLRISAAWMIAHPLTPPDSLFESNFSPEPFPKSQRYIIKSLSFSVEKSGGNNHKLEYKKKCIFAGT